LHINPSPVDNRIQINNKIVLCAPMSLAHP